MKKKIVLLSIVVSLCLVVPILSSVPAIVPYQLEADLLVSAEVWSDNFDDGNIDRS